MSLLEAVNLRNLVQIKQILHLKNVDEINSSERMGQTPLIAALSNLPNQDKSMEKVEYTIIHLLLENGADPNKGEEDDTSPLHRAIRNQKPEPIIKDLIDHGADVMGLTFHGEAPIHFACKDKANLNIIQLLVENDRYILLLN